jgi:L-aminopeptidase/D-esterase-like protein
MRTRARTVAAAAIAGAAIVAGRPAWSQSPNATLTAVAGLRVGHYTLVERPTGCTVILAEAGATAGVDVRGEAPATRETDLLNPVNLVQQLIVLSGGSAFGLDSTPASCGILKRSRSAFRSWRARPIVPGASLFDLNVGNPESVRRRLRYRRQARRPRPVGGGNVGAGAAASADGRVRTRDEGGIGSAALTTPDGLIVAAIVAVNAAGDVIDPATGKVVAGVRRRTARRAHARVLLRSGETSRARSGENTTLGVVATNATLTKTQATLVARMAHDGFARAISPAHTATDGDAIFAMATGAKPGPADASAIGALAAEVIADAILRAARQATGIPTYPAARDLKR